MNKAVFLDRDGVINRKGPGYYVSRKEDFILNEGVTDALKYFISKGYLLVVITNQGGIAKGIYTESQLEVLHGYMKELLNGSGADITDIFYCPHHPDVSLCLCRKPGTLLFEKAIEKYNIDPLESIMIGDSETDILAAAKLGIKGLMIPTNGNMMDLVMEGRI